MHRQILQETKALHQRGDRFWATIWCIARWLISDVLGSFQAPGEDAGNDDEEWWIRSEANHLCEESSILLHQAAIWRDLQTCISISRPRTDGLVWPHWGHNIGVQEFGRFERIWIHSIPNRGISPLCCITCTRKLHRKPSRRINLRCSAALLRSKSAFLPRTVHSKRKSMGSSLVSIATRKQYHPTTVYVTNLPKNLDYYTLASDFTKVCAGWGVHLVVWQDRVLSHGSQQEQQRL